MSKPIELTDGDVDSIIDALSRRIDKRGGVGFYVRGDQTVNLRTKTGFINVGPSLLTVGIPDKDDLIMEWDACGDSPRPVRLIHALSNLHRRMLAERRAVGGHLQAIIEELESL